MVIVFPDGTCAVCEAGLWPGSRKPRVICDAPECKRAASSLGGKRSTIRQRRAAAAQTTKFCRKCERTLPLDREHFGSNGRTPDGTRRLWDSYCRECRRRMRTALYHADPERHLARNRAERAKFAREASEEALAHRRALRAAAAARWRAAHPERARAASKAWREALKQDPERLAAYRQKAREAAERRAEARAAQDADDHAIAQTPLAAHPLGVAVDAWLRRNRITEDDVPDRLGVSSRLVSGWRSGAKQTVRFGRADDVLTRMGLLWWEVWGDDLARRPVLEARCYRLRTREVRAPYLELVKVARYGDAGPDDAAIDAARLAFEG